MFLVGILQCHIIAEVLQFRISVHLSQSYIFYDQPKSAKKREQEDTHFTLALKIGIDKYRFILLRKLLNANLRAKMGGYRFLKK